MDNGSPPSREGSGSGVPARRNANAVRPGGKRLAVLLGGAVAAVAAAAGGFLVTRDDAPAGPPPLAEADVQAPPPDETPAGTQVLEREGLRIAYTLTSESGGAPRGYGTAFASFTVTDARTGAPIRGLKPLAWMTHRRGDTPPDDAACKEQIRAYLGGQLAAQAEVDLNRFLLLALNDDNSISVINPQIAFDRTKLLKLLTFMAKPEDWALSPDARTLWVTLPETNRVAVVDTSVLQVATNVPVGPKPERVAFSPDGKTVWVTHDEEGSVSVVDAKERRGLKSLKTAPGVQHLAFAEDGRTAWVATGRSGKITVFDVERLDEVEELDLGTEVSGLAAGSLSGTLLATLREKGEVAVIDAARRTVVQRIPLQTGIETVRFDRSGRWAFVLNPARDSVSLLDPSGAIAPRTLRGFAGPDAVAFSNNFAYVRNLRDTRVTLVALEHLENGADPTLLQITAGQAPPETAGPAAIAEPIVAAPGGGAFIAAPSDRALLFYQEGMMAPAGAHRNYGREPRAALVLDRSLHETAPGVYSAVVDLGRPGTFDVAFLLDTPRVFHCFEQPVGGEVREADRRVELKPLIDTETPLPVGEPTVVRFDVHVKGAAETIRPDEVEVVAARPPTTWQQRLPVRWAADRKAFEVDFAPPDPGRYKLNVAVPSRRARLGALRPITLNATLPDHNHRPAKKETVR